MVLWERSESCWVPETKGPSCFRSKEREQSCGPKAGRGASWQTRLSFQMPYNPPCRCFLSVCYGSWFFFNTFLLDLLIPRLESGGVSRSHSRSPSPKSQLLRCQSWRALFASQLCYTLRLVDKEKCTSWSCGQEWACTLYIGNFSSAAARTVFRIRSLCPGYVRGAGAQHWGALSKFRGQVSRLLPSFVRVWTPSHPSLSDLCAMAKVLIHFKC